MAKNNGISGKVEGAPSQNVVFLTFLMGSWVALGSIACWFFNPWVALVFFFVVVTSIFFGLRKRLCAICNCYTCTLGLAKTAKLFFGRSKKVDLRKPVVDSGLLIYVFLTGVPTFFLVVSIIQKYIISKIVVLVVLLLISLYSGTRFKKTQPTS